MKNERNPKPRMAKVIANGEEIEVYFNELTGHYVDASDNRTSYSEDELDFIILNTKP